MKERLLVTKESCSRKDHSSSLATISDGDDGDDDGEKGSASREKERKKVRSDCKQGSLMTFSPHYLPLATHPRASLV